jgi:hypothetical protein
MRTTCSAAPEGDFFWWLDCGLDPVLGAKRLSRPEIAIFSSGDRPRTTDCTDSLWARGTQTSIPTP